MKNSTLKAILTLLVVVILLLGAYLLYSRLTKAQPASAAAAPAQTTAAVTTAKGAQSAVKTAAPDFTVYDKAGKQVRLSDYAGKPLIVNFWASWCGPCRNELPYFQKAYETYGGDVQFLMVNLTGGGNDTKQNADKLIADGGYTFPVFYDTDNSAATANAIYSMPVTLAVSADGALVKKQVGGMQESQLQSLIAAVK